jgi:hypothetical protein
MEEAFENGNSEDTTNMTNDNDIAVEMRKEVKDCYNLK